MNPIPLPGTPGPLDSLSAAGVTIGTMLVSLQDSYGQLYVFLVALCYIFSIIFFINAVFAMSSAAKRPGGGGDRSTTSSGIIFGFAASIILAYIPEFFQTMSQTLLCSSSQSEDIFRYAKTPAASSGSKYLGAVIDFIKFCGLVFFINGIIAMRRVAIGAPYQGENWSAVQWRIIGGVAAFNILTVMKVFYSTFNMPPPAVLVPYLAPVATGLCV